MMEERLILILDKLGLVTAIWLLNTDGRRVLTTLRTNHYGYVANLTSTFSLALNDDGTVRSKYNFGYVRWKYYVSTD